MLTPVYPNNLIHAVSRVSVNITTNTTTEIAAATAGKFWKVIGGTLFFAAGAGTHQWLSAATALTPALDLGTEKFGMVLPHNPIGHHQTAVAEALNIITASGCTVKGHLILALCNVPT